MSEPGPRSLVSLYCMFAVGGSSPGFAVCTQLSKRHPRFQETMARRALLLNVTHCLDLPRTEGVPGTQDFPF